MRRRAFAVTVLRHVTRLLIVLSLLAAAAFGGWFVARTWYTPAPTPKLVDEPLAVAPLETQRREVPVYEAVVDTAPRELAGPSPFGALNKQAIEALEKGQIPAAIELWEQCVAGEPDEAVFRHNLAEALLRRALFEHERVRPCPDCLAWLARAHELDPTREAIAKLIERWRAESETEKDFVRDTSTHFALSFDGWRESLLSGAQEIKDELERHYIDLAEVFGVYPGERGKPLVPVVLYRRAEFAQITGLAEWAGASYDGTIRVPISDGRMLDAQLSALMRHELVHCFVRELGGNEIPAWLNEGVAQWFQRDPRAELKAAHKALALHPPLPLERLERSFASLGTADDIAVAYAQSLAFCEFIERQYGRAALVKMIAGGASGVAPAQSFEAWVRLPLATAFADWRVELEQR